MLVLTTPSPYRTDRQKLMELASGKYLVGHEISPIENPAAATWARISLSKTKSSELARRGRLKSTWRENAR